MILEKLYIIVLIKGYVLKELLMGQSAQIAGQLIKPYTVEVHNF